MCGCESVLMFLCECVRASVEGVSVLCAHVSVGAHICKRKCVCESVCICERDLCECECVHVSI